MSSHAQEPDDLDPGGPDPWRGVAELSPVSMSIVGLDGSLSVPNQAFAAMIGYTCAELRGMRFHDITHPDDLASDQDLFDEIARRCRAYAVVCITPCGEVQTAWSGDKCQLIGMATLLLRDARVSVFRAMNNSNEDHL